MSRISIFTNFKVTTNYGAVLQAYALNAYLRNKGYSCETVSIVSERKTSKALYERIPNSIDSLKGFVRIICRKINRLMIKNTLSLRNLAFDNFRNSYIPHTDNITRNEILNGAVKYDVAICGSDQIWRPTLDGRMDDVMWLRGVRCNKKISYAASLGVENLTKSQQDFAQEALYDFCSISVREKSAVELLQPKCNKRVEHVLDPIFLLDKAAWAKFASEKMVSKKKYIFMYFIHPSGRIYSRVRQIAKENDLEVIIIPYNSFFNISDLLFRGEKESCCTLQKFVRLIMDAELVVTDSFHATAFSTLFNTKFYYCELNYTTRIKSLLNDLSLSDRIISSGNDLDLDCVIDWAYANNVLENKIKNSKDFLLKALS